jgi:hypothetical protein
MRTTRHDLALVLVLLGAVGSTAVAEVGRLVRPNVVAASYFPVQPGNHWVYARQGPSGPTTWEVTVAEPGSSAPQRLYDTITGYFPGPRQVRVDRGDDVREWSGMGLRELLWYPLGAPVGTRWEIRLAPLPLAWPLPDCVSGSKLVLASRGETVQVPAGVFENVTRVDWISPCADAGITSEWFAPGVGLVRRDETSFAGPVSSVLVRADLGPRGLPRAAWAATIGLDAYRYVNNLMPPVGPEATPTARGVLEVRNFTGAPVELVFSGCKSVAVEVRDSAGTVVARGRGDDGGCCACTSLLSVTVQGGVMAVPFAIRLAGPEATPLPDGLYTLTATLETLGGEALRPTARIPLEIVSVH